MEENMKKFLLSTVLAVLISTSAVMAQTAGVATGATDPKAKLNEFCKKCSVDATYTDATMPNLTCDAACN